MSAYWTASLLNNLLLFKKLNSFLENGFKDDGEHSVSWDASGFASGIYYIQVVAGGVVDNQKVMLIK